MGDRKARLAALAARAGRSAKGNDNDTAENDQTPSLVFRNYAPTSSSLENNQIEEESPLKKQRTEESTSSVLQDALSQAQREITQASSGRGQNPVIEVTNVHKKLNWDLKRDIEGKLAKLEKRTQKAIVELLKERLEREATEQAGDEESDLD